MVKNMYTTLIEGNNLRVVPIELRLPRFKEAKSLLRKTNPRGATRSRGVMTYHAQDEVELRARMLYKDTAPRSTISARP